MNTNDTRTPPFSEVIGEAVVGMIEEHIESNFDAHSLRQELSLEIEGVHHKIDEKAATMEMVDDLTNQVSDCDNQVSDLEDSIRTLTTDVEAHETEISNLLDTIENLEAAYDERLNDLGAEMDKMKGAFTTLLHNMGDAYTNASVELNWNLK